MDLSCNTAACCFLNWPIAFLFHYCSQATSFRSIHEVVICIKLHTLQREEAFIFSPFLQYISRSSINQDLEKNVVPRPYSESNDRKALTLNGRLFHSCTEEIPYDVDSHYQALSHTAHMFFSHFATIWKIHVLSAHGTPHVLLAVVLLTSFQCVT